MTTLNEQFKIPQIPGVVIPQEIFDCDLSSGEAIPFIIVNQQGEFELTSQGRECIIAIRDAYISALSITGPFRTGKSSLLNHICKFKVGHSTTSCTRGIYVWSKPVSGSLDGIHDCKMFIFDCEGFGNSERKDDFDPKLFALAAFLSSQFVYNVKESLSKRDLDLMEKIADIILTSSQKFKSNFGLRNFSRLYCLIRDSPEEFYNPETDSNTATVSQYFDRMIKNRTPIRQVFRFRSAWTLPSPVDKIEKLYTKKDLTDEDLTEAFKFKRDSLVKMWIHTMPLKTVCDGHLIIAEEFIALIEEFIKILNSKDDGDKTIELDTSQLQAEWFGKIEEELVDCERAAVAEFLRWRSHLYFPYVAEDLEEEISSIKEECQYELEMILMRIRGKPPKIYFEAKERLEKFIETSATQIRKDNGKFLAETDKRERATQWLEKCFFPMYDRIQQNGLVDQPTFDAWWSQCSKKFSNTAAEYLGAESTPEKISAWLDIFTRTNRELWMRECVISTDNNTKKRCLPSLAKLIMSTSEEPIAKRPKKEETA